MRLSKTIEVSNGVAVVRELTVGQIRQLVTDFSKGGEFSNKTFTALFNDDLPRLLNKFNIVQLPGDMQLDDLSLSEVNAIIQAFKELHADFFLLIEQATQKVMAQMNATDWRKTA